VGDVDGIERAAEHPGRTAKAVGHASSHG
jgi:hypothetical protein